MKMQTTQKRLQPCPAAQATAGNIIIMCVWHTPTRCAAAVAMCYIKQQSSRIRIAANRCVGSDSNFAITQKRLQPCPAAQTTVGNIIIIMRVWHTPTRCAAAVAMCYIKQQSSIHIAANRCVSSDSNFARQSKFVSSRGQVRIGR